MSHDEETIVIATTRDLSLRMTLTKVTQRLVQKLVPTTKTIFFPLYTNRLVILLSWIILIKLVRKTKAIQIATTLTFKKFKVIKMITTKIIVTTIIKSRLLIMQIKLRFASSLRRLKCSLNTIIISVLVHEFKACGRRLTI